MTALLHFWAELRRRNVFRAGLAWLALSWLSIEIAARLFPALGFPETAIRWLIIGCGLMVLPMMLFAWLFQLTPEGLRRDRGPQTETPENARSGRRTDQLIIVLILMALASSAVSRFVLPEREALPPAAVTPVERGPLRPMAPAGPVDPRSVAVLPFDSLSPDGGDDWFALGMAEELLNVLARVEGLQRVVAHLVVRLPGQHARHARDRPPARRGARGGRLGAPRRGSHPHQRPADRGGQRHAAVDGRVRA
jgi:adenylate cyclase